MGKRYTFEDAKRIITELSDCVVVSPANDFEGVTSKLRLQCACGTVFQTDLHHFRTQNQRQCPLCGRRNASLKRANPLEDVRQRLRGIGCEYVAGEYINRSSKLTIRCTCGHLRTLSMNSVFYAKKPFTGLCEACSIRRQHDTTRMNLDDVRVLLAAKGLELLSESYENAKTPLRMRCLCGREFESTYDLIRSGDKRPCCRICAGRISAGEQAVMAWLDAHAIPYVREKTFPQCRAGAKPFRFDFYLPTKNVCIEYDGQGHFKIVNYSGKGDSDDLIRTLLDTRERDLLKNRFCEEHGIGLIRIRYDEFDDIPRILSDKLIPR